MLGREKERRVFQMWHGHAREIPLLVSAAKESEDTRGIQATLRPLREKKAENSEVPHAFSAPTQMR